MTKGIAGEASKLAGIDQRVICPLNPAMSPAVEICADSATAIKIENDSGILGTNSEILFAKGLVKTNKPAVANTERQKPQETAKFGSKSSAAQIVVTSAEIPCLRVPVKRPSRDMAPIKEARTTLGSVLTRRAKMIKTNNPVIICFLIVNLDF